MDIKITDQQKIELFDEIIEAGSIVFYDSFSESWYSSDCYIGSKVAGVLNAADTEIVRKQQEQEDAFNNKLLAEVKKVEDWKSRNYSLQELCEKVVHSEMKLDGSNHIECLKLIKDVSGCGLKESKEAYDLARSRR